MLEDFLTRATITYDPVTDRPIINFSNGKTIDARGIGEVIGRKVCEAVAGGVAARFEQLGCNLEDIGNVFEGVAWGPPSIDYLVAYCDGNHYDGRLYKFKNFMNKRADGGYTLVQMLRERIFVMKIDWEGVHRRCEDEHLCDMSELEQYVEIAYEWGVDCTNMQKPVRTALCEFDRADLHAQDNARMTALRVMAVLRRKFGLYRDIVTMAGRAVYETWRSYKWVSGKWRDYPLTWNCDRRSKVVEEYLTSSIKATIDKCADDWLIAARIRQRIKKGIVVRAWKDVVYW